jgi:mannose-6-phosphate isomerase class I
VVLEVSATPYLYSLRFFDWLRADAEGRQRPVHVDHAFRNLDRTRQGSEVADRLVQKPRTVEEGPGWREELLGSLPEMFFEVRRLIIDDGATAEQPDDGRFHVLTLVEGHGCRIETNDGHHHDLHYAETIAIPAAVGDYKIRSTSSEILRLVKANVV